MLIPLGKNENIWETQIEILPREVSICSQKLAIFKLTTSVIFEVLPASLKVDTALQPIININDIDLIAQKAQLKSNMLHKNKLMVKGKHVTLFTLR